MISAQTRSAFVARENRFALFRIMLWPGPIRAPFALAVTQAWRGKFSENIEFGGETFPAACCRVRQNHLRL
jgi:hypothetical protein